ncbi:hypothetical protein ES703_69940 [subsurface metagenome]|jgi:hypothetical protein
MSDPMDKGRKKFDRFMKKHKKAGKSHAEALDLWRKEKGVETKPKGTKVVSKPKSKSKPKTKRESGFVRPKDLWQKLHRTTSRSRVNLKTIQKGINR